jgi:hypothetical protein
MVVVVAATVPVGMECLVVERIPMNTTC